MATTNPDGHDPLFPVRSSGRAAAADDGDNNKLKAFIAGFYAASDDPGRNEDWLSYFAPDAVLIMGDKVVRGTEGELSYLIQYTATKQESKKARGEASSWLLIRYLYYFHLHLLSFLFN